eukprot:14355004-Ditylum_brightwellii.AAC.1
MCIDYMFMNPRLVPALKGAGFLLFNSTLYSDHCALWTDFDKDLQFMGETSNMLEPASRKLISTN